MNKLFTRPVQVVLAGALLATLALPLVGTSTRAVAADKKVLRYSTTEPATFDPQNSSFVDGVQEEAAFFRGLLKYDDKGNPVPMIAKDVPTIDNGGVSKDGKTYTYHLKDWKWSDGKDLTADDFVYAYQRLVDPKLAAAYGNFFNDIIVKATEINNGKAKPTELGVKAIDAKTVQFSLVKAVPYFNAMTSLWVGYAVRKDIVEKNPDGWFDPNNGDVPSSGPFKFTKWDHNKEMVFVKNDQYSGTPAKIDEVDFPLSDDAAVDYAGYKAGEVDVAGFPTAELNNIKADPVLGKELHQYDNACSFYFGFNNKEKPFDNKKVREAFTYAFDRDLYIKVITQSTAKKWLSFLPSAIPANDPELGKDYDFSLDKAKKALADAGYPDGKGFPQVSFTYIAGANGQRRADFLQAMYKKNLNIDIVQNPEDSAVFEAQSSARKLSGMFYLGWCADYLHPSDWLGLVFGADSGNNTMNFNDPAFDKASKAADEELDPAKALDLYKKAQKILVDDFPVVFVDVGINNVLVKPNITLSYVPLDGGLAGTSFWEDIEIK